MAWYTGLAYHDIHLIHTTLADGGGDELRHVSIPQMHMGIEGRGQLNLSQIRKAHVLLLCYKVIAGVDVVWSKFEVQHASEIGCS